MSVVVPKGTPTPAFSAPPRLIAVLISVAPTALSAATGALVLPMTGAGDLPAFTFWTAFTSWGIDPIPFVVFVWASGLYLFGVHQLHKRGDKWPIGRTIMFVGVGMGSFVFATASGVAKYDTTLLSVHMVQHMILSMIVPLACAMGAPITLALRTLPAQPRKVVLTVLQSRVAKVLTFPLFAFALYVLSPWALYFTGWYEASMSSTFVHQMMHIHLVAVGMLFFSPIVGVDPLPNRLGYPARVLLTVMTLPFHAFLGVTIMGQSTVIAADWYAGLREGPMGAWLPAALDDQHVAGGILWASGDAIGLLFFAVLFAQWVRQSLGEAKREDRRLDLMEARAAREAVTKPDQEPVEG